jgi:hypothetical protein
LRHVNQTEVAITIVIVLIIGSDSPTNVALSKLSVRGDDAIELVTQDYSEKYAAMLSVTIIYVNSLI